MFGFGPRGLQLSRRSRGVVEREHRLILLGRGLARDLDAAPDARVEELIPEELVLLPDGETGLARRCSRDFVRRHGSDRPGPVAVLVAVGTGAQIDLRLEMV